MNEEKNEQVVIAALLENPKLALRLSAMLLFARAGFLKKAGVSEPQFALIVELRHGAEEYMTMTDISRKMGHSTPAATGLVDRLEDLGYLERVHAKEDRRKIMVLCTRKAVDLSDAIEELHARALQDHILEK